MLVRLPNPQEIREPTVRNVLVAIRAKSTTNLLGSITLLSALHTRLLGFPEVLAIPAEWSRPPLNIRKILERPDTTGFVVLEQYVIELAKCAEDEQIRIDIGRAWEDSAVKL
jgi:hypothetical protein